MRVGNHPERSGLLNVISLIILLPFVKAVIINQIQIRFVYKANSAAVIVVPGDIYSVLSITFPNNIYIKPLGQIIIRADIHSVYR